MHTRIAIKCNIGMCNAIKCNIGNAIKCNIGNAIKCNIGMCNAIKCNIGMCNAIKCNIGIQNANCYIGYCVGFQADTENNMVSRS